MDGRKANRYYHSGQSGPWSNGTEGLIHTDLQNCNLTIKCNLESYERHHFFAGVMRDLTPLQEIKLAKLVGWFVGFYGISTFVGYLTPNPFLCK